MLDTLPFPVLIGDIGGTNARFALIADSAAPPVRAGDVRTAEYPTMDAAIEAAVVEGLGIRPRSAVLAVAGPISGEAIPLTNCDWVVEPRKTVDRFGLGEMLMLNDFEAQSLCLPGLAEGDLIAIGEGSARPDATRVVLGPGTGLGAAALLHVDGRWVPVPGEGGHVDLGPITRRDLAIWPHLERAHGRISAEALLSGPGLMRLYRGVSAADGRKAMLASPAEVAKAGLAGDDPAAVEALALFATYLGRFAGDFALTFLAHGGVYLAGGIPARIAPVLQAGAFRAAFTDKAPHDALLDRMLTAIVVKPDAALAGIAAFARAPRRFSMALEGRRWRG